MPTSDVSAPPTDKTPPNATTATAVNADFAATPKTSILIVIS
jgi:hypothetical protein